MLQGGPFTGRGCKFKGGKGPFKKGLENRKVEIKLRPPPPSVPPPKALCEISKKVSETSFQISRLFWGETSFSRGAVGDQFLPSAVARRGIVLALSGCQTPAQFWIKIVHPWVQRFYPMLRLGSGGRLLWHFQTPILYWINFSQQKGGAKALSLTHVCNGDLIVSKKVPVL